MTKVEDLYRAFDGPVPAAQLEHAQQQDRAAATAARADPTLALSLRIVAVEEQRNVDLMEWRGVTGWLAQHADEPDGEYLYRDMGGGSGTGATMAQHRALANLARKLLVDELRLLARLHDELAALLERRAA